MDPDAALRIILHSLDEGNVPVAIEALRDLADWLEDEGFLPNVPKACEEW